MSANTRKAQYKNPPLNRQNSQDARRTQVLEEQKRRRAQRIDSARNLDLFAGLTLGPSDDEADDEAHAHEHIRTGISPYAPLLTAEEYNAIESRPSTSSSAGMTMDPQSSEHQGGGSNLTKKKPRRKRRAGGKGSTGPKPSQYADKCMYAELLEMQADVPWENDGRLGDDHDGLPADLESGWIALAPVPAGKRCLVVTYQSSGVSGNVPNTQLRSRLLGKSLLRPFPSPLPAQTILDCILDENWRDNGVLHVLDVIKWKTQDVGDCETSFRFWFRDARLSELPPPSPPLTIQPNAQHVNSSQYRFPYPCTFLPIPYATDTSLPFLSSHVIPAARSQQAIDLNIPQASGASGLPSISFQPAVQTEVSMQVETQSILPTPIPTPAPPPSQVFTPARGQVMIRPDGLLLYVREAMYEPGTSPLSHWIPITLDASHVPGSERIGESSTSAPVTRPLDLFEWLVRRRQALHPPTDAIMT